LLTVEQFELLGALIEVVAQGDAVAPALDLPALGPELQVNRVTGFQHSAQCADVDGLCHSLIGMMGQTARRRYGRDPPRGNLSAGTSGGPGTGR